MGTHETQRSPVQLAADALDFMQHIHAKVSQQNQDSKFITNMNQTSILFTCQSKKKMEWKGIKPVNIHTSMNYSKRATLAIPLCADCSKLSPMLIFKGTENGWIAKNEFPKFLPSCKHYCQENAWIDERAIIKWVENILKPFIEMAPENVVLLLVLDSYQCHMMTSVVKAIQQLDL